jgi:acetyl-CoA carboxylase biotin carboxylase subunit
MFEKILIANRGEIALRVIRAARELGIKTVAVHSTADSESLHVKFADEAICIGPPQSKESYLNIPTLLSAAEVTGADAIHPGYGFLSENAEFAEVCMACGVHFIGPRPAMIKLMGSRGVLKSADEAETLAQEIGFPIILKAAAGGGGRGMKIVRERSAVRQAYVTASAESAAAFGNGDMYLERYVEKPRHIELQIVADEHGNIIHLGERECSVQRRHQKLIEESPSPAMTPALREKMGRVAIEAMHKIGYNNVGTIEFLLDEHGEFYFMEMNTRIQVEHPVTEQVTGIDLVREQILLASGEKLTRTQSDIQMRGHAIECRINAYNPPGGIGVRIDGMAYEQYKVLPHYDSLIAKLIVFADDRDKAIKKMRRALHEYIVEGIRTNIPFHKALLNNPDFVRGQYDTRIVQQQLEAGSGPHVRAAISSPA